MNQMRLLLIACLALISSFYRVSGQVTPEDSLFEETFKPEKFGFDDLVDRPQTKKNKITSANRIPEDRDMLPVKTYVITQDEILRNGYSTLVDVLKTLPGFRTSQPGSALLGETFLMRGLLGNVQAKILINGIPVRPSGSKGMPIGAQLPIKQAERIEIIMGPASSLYGADAMAGVINIVTPEVERPVEAMGHLSLGNGGMNEINLALGGKIGKNKNVLKYTIFGTARELYNINLNLPDDLVRLDTTDDRQLDALGSGDPMSSRWIARGEGNDSLLPLIEDFPQTSRMLGLSLNWRDFTLTTTTMYRQDHSALGSHPVDVGYFRSQTFTAETIYQTSLQYQKQLKKLFISGNLTWLSMNIDEQSEYNGVSHPLAVGFNHMYGSSDDFMGEFLVAYNLNDKWSLMGGVSASFILGNPIYSYLSRPFGDDSTSLLPAASITMGPDNQTTVGGGGQGGNQGGMGGQLDPSDVPDAVDRDYDFFLENSRADDSYIAPYSPFFEYDYLDAGVFAQGYYRGEKLRAIVSLRMDKPEARSVPDTIGQGNVAFSPRFAAYYQIHKKLGVRASFARAFRMPTPYNLFNNFRASIRNDTMVGPPNPPQRPDTIVTIRSSMAQTQVFLARERLLSYEAGLVYNFAKNWELEFHYYHHRRAGSLFGVLANPDESAVSEYILGEDEEEGAFDEDDAIGYYNDNSESRLDAFQLFLRYTGKRISFDAYGQYNNGFEAINGIKTPTYRSLPTYMGGLNIHANLTKKVRLSVMNQLFGDFYWRYVIVDDTIQPKKSQGWFNMDVVASWDVINRLNAYAKVTNLLNTTAKGIFTNPLSGYQFDYLPQQRTMILFGLTYRINR